MPVLLSTRAVSEQFEERRRRERETEEKELFTCQEHYQGWFDLYSLEERGKNERTREA
jgi:hypothetical protein